MKLNLRWITPGKLLVAPVLLVALLLIIAACGSDSPTPQVDDAAALEAEKMAAEKMEAEAMALEAEKMAAEKMESEAMAMEEEKMAAEKMESEAMAMEAEKMAAEKMESEAMAMEEEKMAAEKMESEAMAMEAGPTLKLQLTGVEPLANGSHYEGWAIIDGSPVSTGKFNIDSNGGLVKLDGTAKSDGIFHPVSGLDTATDVIITIEPAGDTDDVPAATHYLAGSLSGGSASLSVGHAAALGTDLSDASGVYILATPTDGAGSNENSGIWFLDLSTGGPSVGLDLPALPTGWVYEGWVVIDGVPVSSGRFIAADEIDQSDPFSGTEGGPPFPGEDYLNNAPTGLSFPTDLSGRTAVISVEPMPDDSPAPFALKPLTGMIPADATDHVTYQLENSSTGLPSGLATVGEF